MMGHPEVEEYEGMVRPLPQVELEEFHVPLALASLPFGRRVVARVHHNGGAPRQVSAPGAQGVEDLFVDAAFPLQAGEVAEELDVVDPGPGALSAFDKLDGNDETDQVWRC